MKKILISACALSLFFIATGCEQQAEPKPTDIAQKKPVVIASFYPFAYLAEQIGGDKIQVINLAGNSEVHEYTLSPQDIATLSNSNLVILEGDVLEPWAKDMLPELQKQNVPVLEISKLVELHTMEAGSEESGLDPHIWLDPVLAQQIVALIKTALIEIAPENTTTFMNNADHLITLFSSLDENYMSGLTDCKFQEVIISHDAFGYIARRYGFSLRPIAGLSTEDEPSAKTMSELTETAKSGSRYILTEQSSVTRFADTLAKETGLEMLPVDPLENDLTDGQKDFFLRAEANLASFRKALECKESL